jgi:hypothetical protein
MPLLIPDAGSVDLGRSRAASADTYAPPNRVNGTGGLQELSSALDKMAGVGYQYAENEYTRKQKEYDGQLSTYVAATEADGTYATGSREAVGRAMPGSSPELQMKAVHLQGARYIEKNIEEDWQKLAVDEATMANPTLLNEKLVELRKKWTDNINKNPDLLWRGGANDYYTKWEDNIRAGGRKLSVDEMMKTRTDAYTKRIGETTKLTGAQTLAHEAAVSVGVDPSLVVPFLLKENPAGDPKAMSSSPNSTASGLFQIQDGTWDNLVLKYGAKYGITSNMKLDGRANALMAAEYAKENIALLKPILGRDPTAGELYFTHLLGGQGGVNFFKAVQEDPSRSPIDVIGKDRVLGNPSIFFKDPKNRQGLMTIGEVVEKNKADIEKGNFYRTTADRHDGRPSVIMDEQTFASKNYKWTDFKHNGVYGGAGKMDSRLINMLDDVTDKFGKKLTFTSNFRDSDYNTKHAKSGPNGPHTHADAADIDMSNYSDDEKKTLVALLVAHGAQGLGHYDGGNNTIHVDLGGSRGGKGKQPDGMSTWFGDRPASEGKSWFNDGIAQGREWRGHGTVPAAGFNGKPMNPYEAMVREGAKYGIRPSEARAQVVASMTQTALAQTDFNYGRKMLSDMTDNVNLTPAQLKTVNDTRTAIDSHEAHQIDMAIKRQHQQDTIVEKKVEQAILNAKSESMKEGGKAFNMNDWMKHGKAAYNFAKDVANDDFVDAGQSSVASASLIDKIYKAASVGNGKGDYSFMGRPAGSSEPSYDEYLQYINTRKDIRTGDRAKIIEGLNKTLAGSQIVHSQTAQTHFKTSVGDHIDWWFKNSAEGQIDKVIGADNLKAAALENFNGVVSNLIQMRIANGGDVPRSDVELEAIYEKATKSATMFFEAAKANNGKIPENTKTGAVVKGDMTQLGAQPAPAGARYLSTTTASNGITVDTYLMPDGSPKVLPRGSMVVPQVQAPPAPPQIEGPPTNTTVVPTSPPPAPPKPVPPVQRVPAVTKPQVEEPKAQENPGVQQIMNNLEDLKNWMLGGTPEQRAAVPRLQIEAQETMRRDPEYARLHEAATKAGHTAFEYKGKDKKKEATLKDEQRAANDALNRYVSNYQHDYVRDRLPKDIERPYTNLYDPTANRKPK